MKKSEKPIAKRKKILLIGIGNDGRADDAMGWRFVDAFAEHTQVFDLEYRYQLQIEDAELVSLYDEVIFVDASREELPQGFELRSCHPQPFHSYTSHELSPETVMWLAKDLYKATPTAYVMAICGQNWSLSLHISAPAQKAFSRSISFFKRWVKDLYGIRLGNATQMATHS